MSRGIETQTLPAIFSLSGPCLSDAESAFFARANPSGFILFQRNCETPEQLRELTDSLRACVGRDCSILIDQEGGRVARLRPPHWKEHPPAATFGDLYASNPQAALKDVRENAASLARDLKACGISVDCAPVLDVPVDGADPIIGDRAFSCDPEIVSVLGRAACEAFLSEGVTPVIKHIPGHGRADADSHKSLPVVRTPRDVLEGTDFAPFRAVADMDGLWAMTAHVLYEAIDPDRSASVSRRVVETIIRGSIGFRGVLVSDDLGMNALSGSFGQRARDVLDAGCDLALHCSGDMDEMREIVDALQSRKSCAA